MKMFVTNGIRGVVNGYLSPELSSKVGKSIAKTIEAVVPRGSLDEQVDSLPKFITIKAPVACSDNLKSATLKEIAHRHEGEKINLTDGLRIDYDDGWALMRPSGTEPKFRVYSELNTRLWPRNAPRGSSTKPE